MRKTSIISNDDWRVEASVASSSDGLVIVEMRLHSAWMGEIPAFTINLDADPAMTDADYEAQALIMMAGSAGELENVCVRESVGKGR